MQRKSSTKLFAKLPDREIEFEIQRSDTKPIVRSGDQNQEVELRPLGGANHFLLLVDNRPYELFIEPGEEGYRVQLKDRRYAVEIEDERSRAIRKLIKADSKSHGQVEVKSPMPGLIMQITAHEGQKVYRGDSLAIIEAMKMENEIRSATDGVVKKVFKKEKESVEKDTILMVIE
ncbi:biotin/lipoyl-binding protein [candidate division KSB1 bacterium]|nr:biotin/lipoyl-binding protein [candidate division KSB1 bacterium]NIR72249.1 biotin/lipoyl-binding protein [candidate division KSB1 bacterium]NIS24220.1 biotin/lipoyl-binding protein [candidate division KSB1 bacterium]NIT71134.1 biotin/lipoyl-binding protein [candidate division KSB1 bacterium]NIU24839.1 biotin/lipoyl-binding protein [candidate division KSB1 bacterium]